MEPITQQKIILNNGVEMPPVGLGTYRIRSADEIMHVVESALTAGYRMFDTAAVYGNEPHLAEAFRTILPKFGLTREKILITTKLSPRDTQSKKAVKEACQRSLTNLGVEYIDVYLIHFPGMGNIDSTDPMNVKLRSQVWEAMVECYNEGLAKAVGVSNYTVRHLKELEGRNFGIIPVINQVECHPYYPQRELLQYCKANGIVLQAYCSLGGTSAGVAGLLEDPVVTNIARKLDVSAGRLLLAWATQQGMSVIPKSTHSARIKENILLDFKIPEADMKSLENLGEKNIKYAWDPSKGRYHGSLQEPILIKPSSTEPAGTQTDSELNSTFKLSLS